MFGWLYSYFSIYFKQSSQLLVTSKKENLKLQFNSQSDWWKFLQEKIISNSTQTKVILNQIVLLSFNYDVKYVFNNW